MSNDVKKLIKNDPVMAIKSYINSLIQEGEIFHRIGDIMVERHLDETTAQTIFGAVLVDDKFDVMLQRYAEENDIKNMDIETFMQYARSVLMSLVFFFRDLVEHEEVKFRIDNACVNVDNFINVANMVANYVQEPTRRVKHCTDDNHNLVVSYGNTTLAITKTKEYIEQNIDKLFVSKRLFESANGEGKEAFVLRVYDSGEKEITDVEDIFSVAREPNPKVVANMFDVEPYFEYTSIFSEDGEDTEFVYMKSTDRASYLATELTVLFIAMFEDTLINNLLYQGDQLYKMWSKSSEVVSQFERFLDENMDTLVEKPKDKRIVH